MRGIRSAQREVDSQRAAAVEGRGYDEAGRPRSVEAPRDLVRLGPVMRRGIGAPEVIIGLIDGPVAVDHPDLTPQTIRTLRSRRGACAEPSSVPCFHGTFVAGILNAKRGAGAPALCPGCTLLVRPIFSEAGGGSRRLPAATPRDLATAIVECMEAGARVLNLSIFLAHASAQDERDLRAVLDHACRRGVVVVAAAGNQASLGGSVLTRHPWVVPVVGYLLDGRPMTQSNLGTTIGRRGVGAPGEGVTSLVPTGGSARSGGTSVAAPFVTGAFGLLLSAFPRATPGEVRMVLTQSRVSSRRTVVPPLLDAWAAYRRLSAADGRR